MADQHVEELFTSELDSLSQYLAPEWTAQGKDSVKNDLNGVEYEYFLYDDKNDSHMSITELVATDIVTVITTYLSAYTSSLMKSSSLKNMIENDEFRRIRDRLDIEVVESLRRNAVENSSYCRLVTRWVSNENSILTDKQFLDSISDSELGQAVIEQFNKMCDEYMAYAPGPWRECVLLEYIRGVLMPQIVHALMSRSVRNVSGHAVHRPDSPVVFASDSVVDPPLITPEKIHSESTEAEVSLSVSEGDDYDSISSGGDERRGALRDNVSVISATSSMRRKKSTRRQRAQDEHLPPRGNMHTLNKLKAEIAMLQERLERAEATDKVILQGKLRECRLDLQQLREKNADLTARVSELDAQLFDALMQPHKLSVSEELSRRAAGVRVVRVGTAGGGSSDDEFLDACDDTSDGIGMGLRDTENAQEAPVPRNSTSSGEGLGEAERTQKLCESLTHMVAAYEKQFQKMQEDMRYLRLLSKRSSSGHNHVHLHDVPATSRKSLSQLIERTDKELGTSSRDESVASSRDNAKSVPQRSRDTDTSNTLSNDLSHREEKRSQKSINKMIQEAVEASKEVDRKTIKALSSELSTLTLTLQEKNEAIKKMESKIIEMQEGSRADHSNGTLDGKDPKSINRSQEYFDSTQNDREAQHDRITLLYAFIIGGIVTLFFSSCLTWIREYN
mmetsp:Transcript_3226/g.5012  ORF Transcript_3226/g.5012 Transcript_3226/m.5012 type:complete len:676 (+) Transcript_3226:131-2158(+)|eukprot:CAMPEP_0185035198 /NCGR_PEP_ID=MMETSP1103-20130426/26145_1 /TAXON_ID=36769 /ORGANISM="Paraphysomonas bandaiensis, Strain Caron Lab Isolate" /LENGTH=675 /DNA_ID=CAMNT_0027572171 /DNA_START=33 /DNA_END=2060 /DNA_ORIENTATION=+